MNVDKIEDALLDIEWNEDVEITLDGEPSRGYGNVLTCRVVEFGNTEPITASSRTATHGLPNALCVRFARGGEWRAYMVPFTSILAIKQGTS